MSSFIDADKYGNLSDLSEGSVERKQGEFLSVFITGQPRANQTPGTMASMIDFDSSNYLFTKKSEVYMIPLFIKRICEAYTKQEGKNYDKLTYFSWEGTKPEDNPSAKVGYLIAGILMNEDFKPIKVEDPENEGEKKTALVVFPCKGTKVGGAIEFLRDLSKKAEELEPLSDNIEFNKNVITPRRFITKVEVATAKTSHGDKYVFKFTPHKLLPNETVKEIMDKSVSLMEKFELQFNKTSSVGASSGGSSSNRKSSAVIDRNADVSFADEEAQPESATEDLGTIDLGL